MKFSIAALAALLILFALACSKSADQPTPEPADSQAMFQCLTHDHGFLPEQIEETADHFVIDGDMMFPKLNFWENYGIRPAANLLVFGEPDSLNGEAADRRHYRSTYLVDKYKWKTIKVNVDASVPQSWRPAIIQAVDAWDDLDGWFNFEVTYFNYSVNGSINVKLAANPIANKAIANCEFPTSSGKPGTPMFISPSYPNLPYWEKVNCIAHEIGHALGMRHTDKGEGTLVIDKWFDCHKKADPNSFINEFNHTWTGFTSCDQVTHFTMYPFQ